MRRESASPVVFVRCISLVSFPCIREQEEETRCRAKRNERRERADFRSGYDGTKRRTGLLSFLSTGKIASENRIDTRAGARLCVLCVYVRARARARVCVCVCVRVCVCVFAYTCMCVRARARDESSCRWERVSERLRAAAVVARATRKDGLSFALPLSLFLSHFTSMYVYARAKARRNVKCARAPVCTYSTL